MTAFLISKLFTSQLFYLGLSKKAKPKLDFAFTHYDKETYLAKSCLAK